MKVLVNGGLNLSVLDGWWAEAYSPAVGWAIGDGNEHGDDPAWDRADAEALYSLLENEIVPEFYNRDEKRIPKAWVARIRESMAMLTPAFSANRTVRQYTEEHYLPAADAYAARAAENGAAGASIASWQREISRRWGNVRFGKLTVTGQNGEMEFQVELNLGGLDPAMVSVQLYADPIDGDLPFRQEMQRATIEPDSSGTYVYSARVSANRAASDFTPRAMPYHPLAGPLEIDRILWQK